MAQVCDFEDQGIDLGAVKSAGFVGIISYASDDPAKNLSQANFDESKSLGLSVNIVCEQSDQPALRGTAGGQHDAQIANEQASALGYSGSACIYYVAEDPSRLPQSDWPTVVEYFQALSGRPRGAYGGLPLVSHLMALGLASYGWVVQTWGGTSPEMALCQLVGANTFGLPIDADQVLASDYGQDPRPGPTPPPTSAGGSSMDCDVPGGGILVVRPDGSVDAFEGAQFYGSLPGLGVKPTAPCVGIAATPSGKGYHIVDGNAAVYCFGDANYYGPAPQYPAQWGLGVGRLIPVIGICRGNAAGVAYTIVGDNLGNPAASLYGITSDGRFTH